MVLGLLFWGEEGSKGDFQLQLLPAPAATKAVTDTQNYKRPSGAQTQLPSAWYVVTTMA